MGKRLENILTELNPLHDFDNIEFHNITHEKGLKAQLNGAFKDMYHLLDFVKPVVRGSVIGGVVGLTASVLSGNSPSEYSWEGALFGAGIDLVQYDIRFVYHYLKAQYFTPDKS